MFESEFEGVRVAHCVPKRVCQPFEGDSFFFLRCSRRSRIGLFDGGWINRQHHFAADGAVFEGEGPLDSEVMSWAGEVVVR